MGGSFRPREVRLGGADRQRFLQGQVSNDVRLANADATLYACVMTVKGKMSADIFIRAEPESLFARCGTDLREALAARLERYIIADDVTLEDVTDSQSLVHVIGPREITEQPAPLASHVGRARSNRFGRDGIDLFGPRDRTRGVARLAGSGRARRGRARAAAHQRRRAALGSDLAEDTIPVEAGLEERAISYTKGCYIGQEVISRIKSVGRVNHHLRRLRASVPMVIGEKLESGGKAAGEITSAAPIPGSEDWLALGYLRSGFDATGTRLRAAAGDVEVW